MFFTRALGSFQVFRESGNMYESALESGSSQNAGSLLGSGCLFVFFFQIFFSSIFVVILQ